MLVQRKNREFRVYSSFDESFPTFSTPSLTYIDGGRTPSGFYAVEEKEYITRFYRVSGSVKVELTALPQDWRYLDSTNVYILDSGKFLIDPLLELLGCL